MTRDDGADLLLYVPTLEGGGAERVFVRLANHYAAQGRRIALIVNRRAGPIADLINDNVRVIEVGHDKAMRGVPRLMRIIRKERPRAVISALTRANLAMVLAVRLVGLSGWRPRVMACERNEYTTASQRLPTAKRHVLTAMVRLLYPFADKVSGNASGVVDDIARVAGLRAEKLCVIPNPAPEAEAEAVAEAQAAPPPHPWLSDNTPVALAMGRLVGQKDYPTMLKAVARCDTPLRLIVLGVGDDQKALQAQAAALGLSERVDFAGFRMNRFDYLARCDLFVLSSLTEGFPNALIEAISFGVPCVSTDCAGGGPRDILAEAFPQALVPVGDSAAMAQAMAAQIATPPKPDHIAALAQRYNLETIADGFEREVMA